MTRAIHHQERDQPATLVGNRERVRLVAQLHHREQHEELELAEGGRRDGGH